MGKNKILKKDYRKLLFPIYFTIIALSGLAISIFAYRVEYLQIYGGWIADNVVWFMLSFVLAFFGMVFTAYGGNRK